MNTLKWAHRPIVALGARGMAGGELVAMLREYIDDSGPERVQAWDPEELDIRDRAAGLCAFQEVTPGDVLNAAACTEVDGCESNASLAMSVNAQAPGHIADAFKEVGATLVYFSTDFVFDGSSDRPYSPDDPARPLSVYGRSKLEGERAMSESSGDHLVIRTSWLFGPGTRHSVHAILTRVRTGQPLEVVTDQNGRPTQAADLAEAVRRLLDRGVRGTVHFAKEGHCSWFDFARDRSTGCA